MGMDLVGINPKDKKGEYFRASVQAWHCIVDILRNTCPDILSRKFIDRISTNGGQQVTVKQSCLIASRLVQYMEHNVDGRSLTPCQLHPLASVSADVLFDTLKEHDSSSALEDDAILVFKISDKHLQEFVGFLHSCRGFTVQ